MSKNGGFGIRCGHAGGFDASETVVGETCRPPVAPTYYALLCEPSFHFDPRSHLPAMTMSPEHQIDLFGMEQTASPEARLAIRKRELRNLLTSYADEADVFTETIQNAFDAILAARNERLYREASGPRLDIVIGRRSGDPHYLLVCDNGVGMPPEVATRFTTPGFTHAKARVARLATRALVLRSSLQHQTTWRFKARMLMGIGRPPLLRHHTDGL